MLLALAVILGLVVGFALRGYLLGDHLARFGTAGMSWADEVTALATAVGALVALVASGVAYYAYRDSRRVAVGQAIARCDIALNAKCYTYKDFHLVKVNVRVKNHSTVTLSFATDVPPFVRIQAYPSAMLHTDKPPLWNHSFTDEPALSIAAVLGEQVLRPEETLSETVLLPVASTLEVSAYRVEFAARIKEGETDDEDYYYEWSATEFVPVAMREVGQQRHTEGAAG